MLRSSEIKPLFVDLSLRDKSFSFFCILRVFLSILWHSFFHLLSDSLYYKTHFLAWFIYIFFFVSFFVFFMRDSIVRHAFSTCFLLMNFVFTYALWFSLWLVVLSMACVSLYGLWFSLWLVFLSMDYVSLYATSFVIWFAYLHRMPIYMVGALVYSLCISMGKCLSTFCIYPYGLCISLRPVYLSMACASLYSLCSSL